MKKPINIDVFPMSRNGEIVYVTVPDARRMNKNLGRLGDAAATASTVANLNSIANLAAAASAAVPTKPVTAQSDFSKTANVVATGAGTVAAVAAVFVPVGTVIAAVAGIVAVAAVLLGKVFANSKAKQLAAERGEYEAQTAQIKYENAQLDAQYQTTYAGIQQMRQALSSLNGLGSLAGYRQNEMLSGLCLWNCKDEKAKLQTAKEQFETVQKEQDSKTQLMAALLTEYNKLLKAGLDLKAGADTNTYILWILGGVALAGAGYAIYSASRTK